LGGGGAMTTPALSSFFSTCRAVQAGQYRQGSTGRAGNGAQSKAVCAAAGAARAGSMAHQTGSRLQSCLMLRSTW
jgi:hypothetical protein